MPQIRRRKPEEEGEINITPMLDIVFIMLIFFIVTTSFVKEPGIDPVRPYAITAATKERGNIMIAGFARRSYLDEQESRGIGGSPPVG